MDLAQSFSKFVVMDGFNKSFICVDFSFLSLFFVRNCFFFFFFLFPLWSGEISNHFKFFLTNKTIIVSNKIPFPFFAYLFWQILPDLLISGIYGCSIPHLNIKNSTLFKKSSFARFWISYTYKKFWLISMFQGNR